MIEFSQNKPRALHVDKRMCSGLLLLFSTEEFLCDLSQNLSVQRVLGNNSDGFIQQFCIEEITMRLYYYTNGEKLLS